MRPRKEEDSEVEVEDLSEDDSAPSEDGAGESDASEGEATSDNSDNGDNVSQPEHTYQTPLTSP